MTAQSATQSQLSNEAPSADVELPAPSASGAALRRNRRFGVALDVTFDNFPPRAVQRTTNISKSGVFVKTDLSLPLHTRLAIQIRLPSGGQLTTRSEEHTSELQSPV